MFLKLLIHTLQIAFQLCLPGLSLPSSRFNFFLISPVILFWLPRIWRRLSLPEFSSTSRGSINWNNSVAVFKQSNTISRNYRGEQLQKNMKEKNQASRVATPFFPIRLTCAVAGLFRILSEKEGVLVRWPDRRSRKFAKTWQIAKTKTGDKWISEKSGLLKRRKKIGTGSSPQTNRKSVEQRRGLLEANKIWAAVTLRSLHLPFVT